LGLLLLDYYSRGGSCYIPLRIVGPTGVELVEADFVAVQIELIITNSTDDDSGARDPLRKGELCFIHTTGTGHNNTLLR